MLRTGNQHKNYITTKTLGNFPFSMRDNLSMSKIRTLVNEPTAIVKRTCTEPRPYIVQTSIGSDATDDT